MINWNHTLAAIWRTRQNKLHPVKQLDAISLDDLLGIDSQKQQLLSNTERFLQGLPSNNVLLWGARGTGKSSLIKALLNRYHPQGLRVIEIDKQDLLNLIDIVDEIRELPQRFLIYCDDLSFESGDQTYKSLKSVLEGSIELPPENVLIYATSNRRHLLPELMRENLDAHLVNDEVHYGDAIEEKISLADRFGLRLGFYPPSQEAYLRIIDHLFTGLVESREALHERALKFAHQNASKSGRTAKQFYKAYCDFQF